MRPYSSLNKSWLVAGFSAFGAFVAFGLSGALIAVILGIWQEATAGFCAAFAVVAMTYISVPRFQKQAAVFIFILGCIAAWPIIGVTYYPRSYGYKNFEPTHIPYAVTVIGGLASLLFCFVFIKIPKSET